MWELRKPTTIENDSATGLERLTGSLHPLVLVTCQNSGSKPKRRNENTLGESCNEIIPFCPIHIDFQQPFRPTSGRNFHCLMFFLMHSLNFWCYTQLLTLKPKLISLLSRNGYTPFDFFSLSYTIEALLSSKPNSSVGLNDWESSYDSEQHSRLRKIGRFETENQRIARHKQKFPKRAWNNSSSLAPKICP